MNENKPLLNKSVKIPNVQNAHVVPLTPTTKKPITIADLDNIKSYEDRQNLLLMHNSVFYQTLLNTIALKNKVDFPPTGPRNPNDIQFQDKKIKLLLQAIFEKNTSATGKPMEYPLGSLGVFQAGVQGARTLASKVYGVGRLFTSKKGGKKNKLNKISSKDIVKKIPQKDKIKKTPSKDKVKKTHPKDKVKKTPPKDKVKKTHPKDKVKKTK
jgi:hypothetical protein